MAAVGFVVPRITYHGIGTLEKLKEMDGSKAFIKLKEHYGITLSASTVRAVTQTHAQHIYDRRRAERIEEQPAVT
ncbi:MAG: hypothetical protein D3919_16475, partial [Candidatus Electrothrix sp. AW5]|nr:hypothetical protein [Candidatus Electrothrix gigas]